MENNIDELLYEQNIKLSDEVTFNLKAINNGKRNYAGVKNWEGYPQYTTYGTVIYNDGTIIELNPVESSKNSCYIWDKGRIFTWNGNNNISNDVFFINDRTHKELNLSNEAKANLIYNSSYENTSVKFNEIEKLENGNTLLRNIYWEYLYLKGEFYLLNENKEVYYIASCILRSPNVKEHESVVWDENNIYFYWNIKNDELEVDKAFDISQRWPRRYRWADVCYNDKVKSLTKNTN